MFHCQWTYNQVFLFITRAYLKARSTFTYVMKYVSVVISKLAINSAVFTKSINEVVSMVAVSGCQGCTIVMSYTEMNKALTQCLLTLNLWISVTWPLTCVFYIPCMHTHEFVMHRGVCDKNVKQICQTGTEPWGGLDKIVNKPCGLDLWSFDLRAYMPQECHGVKVSYTVLVYLMRDTQTDRQTEPSRAAWCS